MDLPSEQIPIDQIRWPPGRSTSIETGTSTHLSQEGMQRVDSEVLRTWLLRRSHESAVTGSPQAQTAQELSSPPRSVESSPTFHSIAEDSDPTMARDARPDEWTYGFPVHRQISPRHSPRMNRAILEVPTDSYTTRFSPLMGYSSASESISSYPISSPLIDIPSSDLNDYIDRQTTDYSVASRQSPGSIPLSVHSSPRPITAPFPSYAALSQAMHRVRVPANRDRHHVSDAFTFGGVAPSVGESAAEYIVTDQVKRTNPSNTHTWVEEPESISSGSSRVSRDNI